VHRLLALSRAVDEGRRVCAVDRAGRRTSAHTDTQNTWTRVISAGIIEACMQYGHGSRLGAYTGGSGGEGGGGEGGG
jgi:hypothetical protein